MSHLRSVCQQTRLKLNIKVKQQQNNFYNDIFCQDLYPPDHLAMKINSLKEFFSLHSINNLSNIAIYSSLASRKQGDRRFVRQTFFILFILFLADFDKNLPFFVSDWRLPENCWIASIHRTIDLRAIPYELEKCQLSKRTSPAKLE